MNAKVMPDAAALPREHEPRASHTETHPTKRTAARRAGRLTRDEQNHRQKRSTSSPHSGDSQPFVDPTEGKRRNRKRQNDPASSFEQKVQALAGTMLAASGGDSLSLAARFRILTEAIAHVSAEKDLPKPEGFSMLPDQTALLYEIVKAAIEADHARAANDWTVAIKHCRQNVERLQELAYLMAAEQEIGGP